VNILRETRPIILRYIYIVAIGGYYLRPIRFRDYWAAVKRVFKFVRLLMKIKSKTRCRTCRRDEHICTVYRVEPELEIVDPLSFVRACVYK